MLYEVITIDALVNDLNRDLSQYISDMDDTEEELTEVTKRLDLINHLKSKYGNNIRQILEYCSECEQKLIKYQDYEAYRFMLEEKSYNFV